MTSENKSAVNRVYYHSAIQAFAETGGGVFFLALLLNAGLTPPLALCAMAAILLGRYALRSGVLPLARRIGLRRTLIAGTILESSTYWLTPHVAGIGPILYAVIALGALGSVIYWTSYHAYVAATGETEGRGRQVGIIEAVNAIVAIIAPAIVGLLIVNTGPLWAYAVVGLVQVAAAVPLMQAPDVEIPHEAEAGRSIRRFGTWLYGFDGAPVAFAHFLWLIALFTTLGERFAAYGWAMALAGLAGAAMSLVVGRLIDLGHGGRSVLFAYGLAMLAAIAKALSFEIAWAAVAAAAFGAIAASVQIPVMMARVYTLAKDSGCPLRFHMAAEAGWDLGCATGCLIAAALIAAGVPLGLPILLALVGQAAAALMLRKSYGSYASASHKATS
jgi:MFS transporter, DHA1 family, inner membrane transport protein